MNTGSTAPAKKENVKAAWSRSVIQYVRQDEGPQTVVPLPDRIKSLWADKAPLAEVENSISKAGEWTKGGAHDDGCR